MINFHRPTGHNQKGFTIVELMIATAVLSLMLLIVSVIIINIGSLYQKGVNQTNTQDDVRTIADQVEQDVKYGQGIVMYGSGLAQDHTTTVSAYCIGSVRYSFVVGHRIGDSGGHDPYINPTISYVPDVIWRDNDSAVDPVSNSNSSCVPVDVTKSTLSHDDPSGSELIAANSRLTAFCIEDINSGSCDAPSPSSGTPSYKITIGVAYGDADLLGISTHKMPTFDDNPDSFICVGNAGDQFCSTSSLITIVVPRLSGGGT